MAPTRTPNATLRAFNLTGPVTRAVSGILLATMLPLPAASRPNILFILIDDLGWRDLGVQGNKVVHTPSVDCFAMEGMRFTDAYSASPVCSPTRAAIMTGLSPARLHLTNHTPDESRFKLPRRFSMPPMVWPFPNGRISNPCRKPLDCIARKHSPTAAMEPCPLGASTSASRSAFCPSSNA